MKFDLPELRGYQVSALAMARGEHALEDVTEGMIVAFVMLWGCVQITRKGTEQPARFCLHATRTAPLFIINPGSYCVLAESNVLGVRGMRRRGPTL